ncbi:hypothetical protein [Geobacter sp.]|uniref:hypothetical protein n=1 Tax=Geobacter sp. TaxID=46610 RepID=UPI0026053A55|nr:hypothetical protein [Geobacter sp.]
MNQSLGTAEEWQRWIVARKLIAGEILTDLERKKAAEWIVGQPINLPEGTGNRGKSEFS